MNRYEFYTRSLYDEQDFMTDEIYYPDCDDYDDPSYIEYDIEFEKDEELHN